MSAENAATLSTQTGASGSAEKDARAETLERWRSEASRLGGVPAEHPGVPAEYVYMANRLVSLIDDLTRVPSPEATQP